MPHAGIIGMTTSGKTTLGIAMAHAYRKIGTPVLVCDPKRNPGWKADRLLTDIGKFIDLAKRSTRCALFVEEAGDFGKHPDFEWLFTQARNWGHVSHYLSQFHRQVPPIVRGNIERLFLFKAGHRCVEEFADEFAQPEIRGLVAKLQRYQFVQVERYGPPVVRSLDLTRNGREKR